MFSVYQHWDPLKVCVVGQSYPPEYYSWIDNAHVRSLFERIATETEEDYQNIINKLTEFGVRILRPKLPSLADTFVNQRYLPPPMMPRDHMIVIGTKFYYSDYYFDVEKFYNQIKDESWPECSTLSDFEKLPQWIQDECINVHGFNKLKNYYASYDHIYQEIAQQGNQVIYNTAISEAPGANITRIGRDLYFGTDSYSQDQRAYRSLIDQEFTQTRNHIVNTGGHADGTYCPVCPGLIISTKDVKTYAETFPGWEVVYLPNACWKEVNDFIALKTKNKGKWWIPGFERDQAVIDVVETWLSHWVGYVEETVFDVNMLIIDPKNVIVFNYNKQVFDALERFGITPHVVPFRHRHFWDGGIHCVTSDLHREGAMQDYFSKRG